MYNPQYDTKQERNSMENTINFYRSDSQLMNDAIDRIVVEVHGKKNAGGKERKTILLTGCSPESGTTTLAINLAIALSNANWKTLLVDCDLRKAMKYKRLGADAKKGLSDYLNQDCGLNSIISGTNYETLDYITCGSVAESPVRLLCSVQMELFLEEVRNKYDYIVFDCPSLNVVSDANILFPYIDGIALVSAINKTSKRQLSDALDKVEKYDEKYYGMLINQVELSDYRKYIKDYDYFRQTNIDKKYRNNLKRKKIKLRR